ncbi:hypothetical protein [Pararhizobium arenae]|uniref:hypothetical protein n=1 Tax=Pararhizobium arenae TaxID=1856850 RepID=UPI00094AD4B6|nr:hypothetical protein [Pararhizobium arenae]
MFQRAIVWAKAVGVIGDIVKGTSNVSLRQYRRAASVHDGVPLPVFGWDYHRVQAHGSVGQALPKLVSDARLTDTLLSLVAGPQETFAYEVDGSRTYDPEAKALAQEFSDISVTTVRLAVGDVRLGWFLVSLNTDPDIVHWKMRYHEREGAFARDQVDRQRQADVLLSLASRDPPL